MPYAPEYGLVAYTFQLLSRSHSHLRYLNWNRGRQLNLRIMPQAISLARASRLSLPSGTLTSDRVWANAPAWPEIGQSAESASGPDAGLAPGTLVPLGQFGRLDVCWWLTAWLPSVDAKAQLVAAMVAARVSAVALATIVSLDLDVDVRNRTRDVDTMYFRPGTEQIAVLNVHPDCVQDRREFKATNQLH